MKFYPAAGAGARAASVRVRRVRRAGAAAAALSVAGLLASCGGGGSSGSPADHRSAGSSTVGRGPATPVSVPASTPRTTPGSTPGPTTPGSTPGAATTVPVDVEGAVAGAPARPGLTSLSVPHAVTCTDRGFATVSMAWSFAGATSVGIGIDAGARVGPYPASGSTTVRFPCDGRSHSYFFRATGPGGSTTATALVRSA